MRWYFFSYFLRGMLTSLVFIVVGLAGKKTVIYHIFYENSWQNEMRGSLNVVNIEPLVQT